MNLTKLRDFKKVHHFLKKSQILKLFMKFNNFMDLKKKLRIEKTFMSLKNKKGKIIKNRIKQKKHKEKMREPP